MEDLSKIPGMDTSGQQEKRQLSAISTESSIVWLSVILCPQFPASRRDGLFSVLTLTLREGAQLTSCRQRRAKTLYFSMALVCRSPQFDEGGMACTLQEPLRKLRWN